MQGFGLRQHQSCALSMLSVGAPAAAAAARACIPGCAQPIPLYSANEIWKKELFTQAMLLHENAAGGLEQTQAQPTSACCRCRPHRTPSSAEPAA